MKMPRSAHSSLLAALAALFLMADAAASDTRSSALRNFYGVDVTRVAERAVPVGKLSNADQRFLKDAAVDGLYEVEVGEIARQRASDDPVKAFAETLVAQHSAANDELRQLASARNVALPNELPVMKRRAVEKLRKTKSSDFDHEFIDKMVIEDHEKDIKHFEKASRELKDAELRAWAEKMLPALRQHLADARNLSAASVRSNPVSRSKAANKSDAKP